MFSNVKEEEAMRQDEKKLQHKIDAFLQRKTTQYPDVERYAEDIYR